MKKSKFVFPNVIFILLIMMLLAMIATWIVPSGLYDRVEENGRAVVMPGTYNSVEASPVNIFEVFKAIPEGLTEAGMIAWTIIIIGGTWQILTHTGTIHLGVERLTRALGNREYVIIPIVMLAFASISAFIGALELAVVYIPVMIALCKSLRLDMMTAAGIALVSTGGAFAASLTNPFTVGLGQEIAGLPLYSGIGYRVIVLFVILGIGILYVLRYASKVKKDHTASLVYDESLTFQDEKEFDVLEAKAHHKIIGFILILAFAVLIYGILTHGWFMFEIGAVFFIIAILSGLIGKMSLNKIADEFIKGGNSVLLAALVVGLARSILIIIENGQIIDTIIYGLTSTIDSLPHGISIVGIFIVQSLFNFLVPSGSGQVLITMPILSSTAEIVGITQQTTVLATQLGDGFTNIMYPVSGALMAVLAYAKIPYMKWLKFITPLIITWTIIGALFLIIANYIQWGPF